MSYVPVSQSYIFSSDPANGALNVTENGSSFVVQLDSPISVPPEAVNCTLECQQASIWFTSPNISATEGNNIFRFIQSGVPKKFVIPDGLYTINELNQLISREMVRLGFKSDQIVLSGDNSTQRSVLTFNYAGTQADFRGLNTPRTVLGFDARLSPPATSTVGISDPGDDVASFNKLNSWLVHTTLTSRGIPVNDTGANIVARVPIDVKPGKQVNYAPVNPTHCDARELVGRDMSTFLVWLTDQNDRPIDTFGEYWQVLLVIRYMIAV